MSHLLQKQSLAGQTASQLRREIASGRWQDKLPGAKRLAAAYDVSPVTMRAALKSLEREGWVTPVAPGHCRRVAGPDPRGPASRSMHVVLLLRSGLGHEDAGFQTILYRIKNDLEVAGHACSFAAKSLASLRNDPHRISRFVEKTAADAWVVTGGSHAVLSWFAICGIPSLAIGGRCIGLPIASTGLDLMPAFRTAMRHLLDLGHRRILFLSPHFMRNSDPSSPVIDLFYEELASCGVTGGRYHLPDWDESPDGLFALLDQSFRYTPPTAIVTTYTNWTVAVLSFLTQRGLTVPRDVSLLCINSEDWFPWHRPTISHLAGDENRMVRRVVRWVNAAARGQQDCRPAYFPMRFVATESIAPAIRPHHSPAPGQSRSRTSQTENKRTIR